MRIALFAPYLPLPAVTGGRIRVARLAEGLTRRGEVVLFATGRPRGLEDPEVRALHDEAFSATYIGINRFSFWPRSDRPRRVARCESRALRAAFSAEMAQKPFDGAVVAHSYAASLPLGLGLPFLLDEHNVESAYDAERARARGKASQEEERFRRWEDRAWRAARSVVAVSSGDADEIRARAPDAPVHVVPNGVSVDRIRFVPPSRRAAAHDPGAGPGEREGLSGAATEPGEKPADHGFGEREPQAPEVLFVGLMSHRPNIWAARRLVERVMPIVWRQVPAARLVLCGHAPRPEVRALAGGRVTVTGSVPDVAPYLESARVMVNPLAHGAGTSLKVVEALASGAPLVSTAVGLRGYPEALRDLCDVADEDEPFAKVILRHLEGSPDDHRAEAARRMAEDYDWRVLSEHFADLTEAALL